MKNVILNDIIKSAFILIISFGFYIAMNWKTQRSITGNSLKESVVLKKENSQL